MNRFHASLAGALLVLGFAAQAQNTAPQAGPKSTMPASSSAQVLPDFADFRQAQVA